MLTAFCALAFMTGITADTGTLMAFKAPLPAVPVLFGQARARHDFGEPAAETAPDAEWTDEQLEVLERESFSLKYPRGWNVDAQSSGYDLDYHFSIDAPGDSHVTFEFFDWEPGLERSEILQRALHTLDGVAVKTMSRADFNQWGAHQGIGKHLKGKILGVVPGGCRVFLTKSGDKGLLITEFYMSRDLNEAMPGFQLISQTLVIN